MSAPAELGATAFIEIMISRMQQAQALRFLRDDNFIAVGHRIMGLAVTGNMRYCCVSFADNNFDGATGRYHHGRLLRVCGFMGTNTMASSSGCIIGPPP